MVVCLLYMCLALDYIHSISVVDKVKNKNYNFSSIYVNNSVCDNKYMTFF